MISTFYKLYFLYLIFFNVETTFSQQNNSIINLKEDLIINSNDIGKINEIQIDSKGQIFISDGINQCIHLFSSKGKFLRKIGRKGNAPGEYQYIWGIQITKGDTLIVYDGVQYRITIYAPGNFDSSIKTLKLPTIENNPDMPGVIGNIYSGISGLWVPANSNVFLIIYNTPYSSNDLTQKHYSKLYIVDSKGKLVKNEPVIKIQDVERLKISSGGNFMVSDMPFGRRPIINLNKDGIIYYGETNNFKITGIDLNSKMKNEISSKIDRITITDKMWQKELKNYANLTLKDLKKSKTTLPEHLPIIEDFTIDDKDNIWVAVNQKDYKSYKYYIFNNQGKLINTTYVPDKTVIKIVNKNFAYGIRTDDWGIQSIVRYKMGQK
ncbi:MAG TPA: 6-bladed beta-propeller [Ignavibacteriaceae bacterium]|nr:6-bladed beta-propeller [Ignavibacteriaceae bacterium]HRP92159.1 6-bladed beta-propeller [Ignavibacteriaceae bacterium]HRQ53126.1 6-bladed beta-propeller [Ignavibacteriaceae bacterium]